MAIDLGELRRLRALFSGGEDRVRAAVLAALDQSGRKIEADAKRRAPVSSGLLRSSIGYQVREPGILEVGVFTGGEDLKYARIQDQGGKITARSGGWLAIPLKAVKTKAGVGGIRARDVMDSPGDVGVRSTFFQVSRAANLILFGKLGQASSREKSDIVPLFVLKGSVTLKGNRYLTGAVEDNLPTVASFIARRVSEVLAEAA